MVLPLPVYLLVQHFPSCFRSVSLVHGLCELLLPPLYADFLQRLCLQFSPCGEGLTVLLQLPKAHYQVLGCQLDELVWLPSHQGLTCIAVWVIMDAGTVLSSGGLGRPLVLMPALPL